MIKEGPTITIKDFNNLANQDTLYKDYPLFHVEKTDSQFNIKNKKELIQELV
jgi:hypothetical protein